MKTKPLVLFAALMLAQCTAQAGMVQGHRLVWMNLAADPAPVDTRIQTYIAEGRSACLTKGSIVFMRNKPTAMTRQLVIRALIRKDPGAIADLNRILLRPFPDAEDGFDGIIAYSDQPAPRMYSLTRGRHKIKSEPVWSPTDKDDLEVSYCVVAPPIVRLS